MPNLTPGQGSFTTFFDDLDDWCGTRPPRRFPPRTKALRDVLLSTVIHEAAERVSDQKIQAQLQSLAGELHEAGSRGLVG